MYQAICFRVIAYLSAYDSQAHVFNVHGRRALNLTIRTSNFGSGRYSSGCEEMSFDHFNTCFIVLIGYVVLVKIAVLVVLLKCHI